MNKRTQPAPQTYLQFLRDAEFTERYWTDPTRTWREPQMRGALEEHYTFERELPSGTRLVVEIRTATASIEPASGPQHELTGWHTDFIITSRRFNQFVNQFLLPNGALTPIMPLHEHYPDLERLDTLGIETLASLRDFDDFSQMYFVFALKKIEDPYCVFERFLRQIADDPVARHSVLFGQAMQWGWALPHSFWTYVLSMFDMGQSDQAVLEGFQKEFLGPDPRGYLLGGSAAHLDLAMLRQIRDAWGSVPSGSFNRE